MRRFLATVLFVAAWPPAAASAARLDSASSLGVGDEIAVVARGLERARGYELTLGAPLLRGSPSTCGARIGGPRDATSSRTVFSGRLPRYLSCVLPDGTRVGRHRVAPGRMYRLVVCVPINPALCDGARSFGGRRVRILPAGRRCRPVGFQAGTEDIAAGIRAAGVSCGLARDVAGRSKVHAKRCFAHRTCSYRARRLRCRGTVDRAELPGVTFRCTRGRTRVTFVKT